MRALLAPASSCTHAVVCSYHRRVLQGEMDFDEFVEALQSECGHHLRDIVEHTNVSFGLRAPYFCPRPVHAKSLMPRQKSTSQQHPKKSVWAQQLPSPPKSSETANKGHLMLVGPCTRHRTV
jgi:hypothetical protein